ncbi:MAG: alanine racemase [Acidobacteriaceae bacterium]
MPPLNTRPVWAEISRSRLLHNYRALCALAGPSITLIPVVKADAYGHSVALCAPWLAAEGAQWLCVTSVEEAIAVRALCPSPHILVLSGLWHNEADAILAHRLTPVVWEQFHLELLADAARRASRPPQSVPIHLEIDTGMCRQGVAPGTHLAPLLQILKGTPQLRLEAVMTHFFAPDELDSPTTQTQIRRFATVLDTISAAGLHPQFLHAGNSTTLLTGLGLPALRTLAIRHQAQLMLRPGLALYGYQPATTPSTSKDTTDDFSSSPKKDLSFRPKESHSDSVAEESAVSSPTLQPVLALKSRIVSLRKIAPGESAGYNATFRATRPTRLALLPLGYADGLSRQLSNQGHALIQGQRAPIAGRISMDHTILDVTHIPDAAIGDEAVLLGEQNLPGQPPARITAEDLATLCHTIPWEILTSIAARVPRIPAD